MDHRYHSFSDSTLQLELALADHHLSQGRVQRFEVEDQVQLAHVLEEAVQSLYEHLDEVQERER